MQFNLIAANGYPHILCDDDIAEKLGISRGAVCAYRKKRRIPDRDVRVDCALKTLFSVTHECVNSVNNMRQILAEQVLNEPIKTEIIVTTTTVVTAAVTGLFFYLFLM